MGVQPLPRIMVAPNGARRTTADHPALPVKIPQIIETAKACFAAGAGGIHAHVRNAGQHHVLDAGLYRELVTELAREVPEMAVQITTEAVGRYTPEEQRAVVRAVMPDMVSVALREMIPDADTGEAARFYAWAHEAQIAVQHIVYGPDELDRLAGLIGQGVVPAENLQLLFVLGRYAKDQESDPRDLQPFIDALRMADISADWAACAFGRNETASLAAAFAAGGKARVGFENSLWNADGTVATDNAERVREIAALQARSG
ncbi:3-keto-5-aminohexanoate cleavage protein [Oricola indica]|uniref:3-keto-5-aminohexanoate cleavage protein n=1 Tax=Oricola indica TaxID=2872591 RepID=UPI003CCC417C